MYDVLGGVQIFLFFIFILFVKTKKLLYKKKISDLNFIKLQSGNNSGGQKYKNVYLHIQIFYRIEVFHNFMSHHQQIRNYEQNLPHH